MLKNKLLDKVFAVDGSFSFEQMKGLKNELLNYVEEGDEDHQIEELLLVIEKNIAWSEGEEFEPCCQIVRPAIERLLEQEKWDFYDIRLCAAVLGHAETFEVSHGLAERALEGLSQRAARKEPKGLRTKLIVYTNAALRFLRARYFEVADITPELLAMFLDYTESAAEVSEEMGRGTHRSVIKVMEGLFYQNDSFVNGGFNELREAKEYDCYRMLQNLAGELGYYTEFTMSKKQFNAIVGANLKRERLSCGLSQEELAKLLGVSVAAIGLMERGDRGITGYNLRRFASIFAVPVDIFHHGIGVATVPGHKRAKRQQLAIYARGLADRELDYLILMAKNMPQGTQTG